MGQERFGVCWTGLSSASLSITSPAQSRCRPDDLHKSNGSASERSSCNVHTGVGELPPQPTRPRKEEIPKRLLIENARWKLRQRGMEGQTSRALPVESESALFVEFMLLLEFELPAAFGVALWRVQLLPVAFPFRRCIPRLDERAKNLELLRALVDEGTWGMSERSGR